MSAAPASGVIYLRVPSSKKFSNTVAWSELACSAAPGRIVVGQVLAVQGTKHASRDVRPEARFVGVKRLSAHALRGNHDVAVERIEKQFLPVARPDGGDKAAVGGDLPLASGAPVRRRGEGARVDLGSARPDSFDTYLIGTANSNSVRPGQQSGHRAEE